MVSASVVGRSHDNVLVVGPNAGFSFSFCVSELRGLCCLDVPAGGWQFRCRDVLPPVLAVGGHGHAIAGHVPRERVSAISDGVVAYVNGDGNLKTTLQQPPTASRERVLVRIGDESADRDRH